jgi:ubiquinone/menaquinone biosynthesis C-methylase UbiE
VLGGGVAEVRWGSGRILVRAGHHVVGVDTSPHMLALACEKLATAGSEVARARLVQGDLRYFDLAIVAVKNFLPDNAP